MIHPKPRTVARWIHWMLENEKGRLRRLEVKVRTSPTAWTDVNKPEIDFSLLHLKDTANGSCSAFGFPHRWCPSPTLPLRGQRLNATRPPF